mmetsp:Transcript_51443/g.58390  ORF Transcript_51443/g.58390 Transcript_51443/m.58390 type:complete len:89 (+) Transcript_51443:352-618(+)
MDFEEQNSPIKAATTSSKAAKISSSMELETVEEEDSPITTSSEAATTSEAATMETATATATTHYFKSAGLIDLEEYETLQYMGKEMSR